MSIASEITRLQTAKADLKTSIENKGVAVSSSATLDEYPALVDAIPTGGGGLEPKLVNFIDYDGTLLYAYDDEEFAELTALPSNPTHTDMGLVPDGWNWTLAEIQTQLTAMPEQKVWVGQMYHTASGATEIDVEITDASFLTFYIDCPVNGTITIDWGDETSSTIRGNSLYSNLYTQHTYASTGAYTIGITPSGTSTYSPLGLSLATNLSYQNYYAPIQECIKSIRYGNGVVFTGNMGAILGSYTPYLSYVTAPATVALDSPTGMFQHIGARAIVIPSGTTTLASYNFAYSCTLECVSLPYGITSMKNTFANCTSLKYTTIPATASGDIGVVFQRTQIEEAYFPSGITITGTNGASLTRRLRKMVFMSNDTALGNNFAENSALEEVTLPNGASLPNYAFTNCNRLERVSFTSGTPSLTSIGSGAFSFCYSLRSIVVPSSVTTLGTSAFASNWVLESVTMPSSLASIGQQAFANCYFLKSITIPSGVTSIGSSAFSSCYSLNEIRFEPTTPPTLGNTTVFNNIPKTCKIYVPSGTLSAYTSATNYPSASTYTYIEY